MRTFTASTGVRRSMGGRVVPTHLAIGIPKNSMYNLNTGTVTGPKICSEQVHLNQQCHQMRLNTC